MCFWVAGDDEGARDHREDRVVRRQTRSADGDHPEDEAEEQPTVRVSELRQRAESVLSSSRKSNQAGKVSAGASTGATGI